VTVEPAEIVEAGAAVETCLGANAAVVAMIVLVDNVVAVVEVLDAHVVNCMKGRPNFKRLPRIEEETEQEGESGREAKPAPKRGSLSLLTYLRNR
jgi:hypothetical protein